MDYYDLSLRVQENGDILASSAQGDWQGKLNLDYKKEIGLAMQLIEKDETDKELLQKVGSALFGALFNNNISSNLAAIKAHADENECGVRLRLIFENPEIASIPWEFLYDDNTNTFLANDPKTAISRYINVPLKKQDIKPASLPLRMLLIISSPDDMPHLDSDGEEKLIRQALQDHVSSGQIEIDTITQATITEIDQRLNEKPYNVLHFIGHGVFENNKGFVVLMDENGHAELLDEERFANLFLDKKGLGLAILNSCEGAKRSSSQVFAGMAPHLVRRGIPAIIAMQYSIRDSTAKLFADKFYRSLALAKPVDEAVQSTRNLISVKVGLDKRDFATPVLYMRAVDGIILDLAKANEKELSVKDFKSPELPPKDDLPEPDIRLPIGSKHIALRNRLFTGRQEDLKWLASALLYSSPDDDGTGAVITGWRGVGKSQLAIEFCYRYGRFLQGVHWVQADQNIPTEIADCGRSMNLSGWPDKLQEQVDATLKAWRDGGLHLIVFDNVENHQVVQDWLSRILPAKLLVTSYQTIWPTNLGMEVKELKTLDVLQSKELLCKLAPRLGQEDDSCLDELANRLDNLPLALDLAGRYLAFNPDISPSDYLSDLEDASCSLEHTSLKLDYGPSPTNHIPLGATVGLSWKQLKDTEIDILAKLIFRVCGYCAPNNPVPRTLLEDVLSTRASKQMLSEALMKLDRLGLIAPTKNGRMQHGLLAEFARQKDLEADESVLPALVESISRLTTQAVKSKSLEKMRSLHEHLDFIAQAAEEAKLPKTGVLWNNLGRHLQNLADYESAREILERALKIDEQVYGPDHPDVARDVNSLGGVLQDQGEFQEARKCYERALKIDEQVYGPDHPDVARDVNSLGSVLQALGEFQEARKYFERALKIDEQVYGPDHPEVAVDVNNLGSVLQDLGDFQEARKCYERALKIDELVYGHDHPEVATIVSNLGLVLQAMREFQEARECYERSLKIDELVYGPDHPNVAIDVNNLGGVLQDLGEFQEARKCYERSLKINELVYGPDHPNVAIDVNNLGSVLKALREFQEARKCYERSLKINEQVYGPDHPDVARDVNNLGLVLQVLGDRLNAKKYLKRALKIYEKSLGSDHATTRMIKKNLRKLAR